MTTKQYTLTTPNDKQTFHASTDQAAIAYAALIGGATFGLVRRAVCPTGPLPHQREIKIISIHVRLNGEVLYARDPALR